MNVRLLLILPAALVALGFSIQTAESTLAKRYARFTPTGDLGADRQRLGEDDADHVVGEVDLPVRVVFGGHVREVRLRAEVRGLAFLGPDE